MKGHELFEYDKNNFKTANRDKNAQMICCGLRNLYTIDST